MNRNDRPILEARMIPNRVRSCSSENIRDHSGILKDLCLNFRRQPGEGGDQSRRNLRQRCSLLEGK